ncbi:MAG: 16S rRNA (adenine(1518)-N(6)/adenine(1519)-N(6))-dimethyltransferase RsmA [Bacteroidales bacterium]|nr:16S rRNA (adenine(1518)-N(6)/adenine(1519)-N(6))-dimethyltransferase RsmA [Bacteroidales bacterium]
MEVRAKKALGQHFLTDLTIAQKIVDALSGQGSVRNPLADSLRSEATQGGSGGTPPVPHRGCRGVSPEDATADSAGPISKTAVLEIGPGMGVLTQYLLQRDDINLKLVELDGESVDYLLTHFPGMQGRLYQADYLRLDIHKLFPGPYRVIGNFPYNISSQIFFKILDDKDRIPEVVCMIQKEVAERIAEAPGSKTYGILSVLLQAWYDIEYLFTVGSGAFSPPPKVQSAVIRLRRNARTDLGCDEKLFKAVVKTAFNQRRKTLRNALKPLLPEGFDTSDPVFDLRAERLGVEDFAALTEKIFGPSR